MRIVRLEAEFVEFIPEQLSPGILYVSHRYATAVHLCCCGCGLEVVTPLNLAKWHLSEREGRVSLSPSIGNWGFSCQSPYWIEGGDVRWAGVMSPAVIASVKACDRKDAQAYSGMHSEWFVAFWRRTWEAVTRTIKSMRRLWPSQ